ncbi:hypothetical protein FCI59_18615 [Pseudomonas protegens]|jgi:hypothetical protein|uniref:hypothetical protein n=1 Tax=Pseudomonas protegens TaxID=380021 RepID=UPI001575C2AE|nr:hypothetical protein [Pseudomonas protegens]NTZ73316.1 hypothetical protein [Pseudomonas protegens]
MGNLLRKGLVALVRIFSGDDPVRLLSLMLAAYLGISACTVPASTAGCCQPSGIGQYPASALPAGSDSNLTLDAEPVIGRTALPTNLQPPAPRWVF